MTVLELMQRTTPVVTLARFYRTASDDIAHMATELEAAGWSERALREVRQMAFVAYVAARAEERDHAEVRHG
jgi:hypothetical protein